MFELLISVMNNIFIGLPIAEALYGATAVLYCALSCIPYNLLLYSYGVWRLRSGKAIDNGGSAFKIKDVFTVPLFATLTALLIFIFSPKLIGLFTGDAESIAFGVMHQRTTTPFFFLLAYSHCMAAIFRGAGKSTVPMLVMMLCWCIIRVIYVTVAVKFFPVLQTVSWAYPITWGLSTLVFTLYYFKADWMHAFERREKHA